MEVFKAGNIEVSYQNGFLRYFKTGDTEVLRMIYFAVRNANWENWDPVISNEEIVFDGSSFRITYLASYYDQNGIFFQWHVRVQGLEYNEVRFEIVGKAFSDFHTNRAGFCILHPIENIAGEPVTVLHSDNEEQIYEFPKWIAPHQPFIDINSMQWKVGENEFRLEMQGDIFEIEDQRNWGDASYKTYCTPLSIPFPRKISSGDTFFQKVTFKASLVDSGSPIETERKIDVNTKFKIGISDPASMKIPAICAGKLKALSLDHYRVEVDCSKENWEKAFFLTANQSKILETRLEVVLKIGSGQKDEINQLIDQIIANSVETASLTLINKDGLVTDQVIIDLIPKIKKQLPEVQVGIGTLYNFTELNRNRFNPGEADFIALSFDPQEHASDDLTILENAETLKYLTESLYQMYQKPVHFSPIMLKRRFNPYATDKNEISLPMEKQLDTRQKTRFLADWVELVFKNLEQTNVASVTLFQAVGELGIMDEEGNEYPVYNAIKNYANRNQ